MATGALFVVVNILLFGACFGYDPSYKYCDECIKVLPVLNNNETMSEIEQLLDRTLCLLVPSNEREDCRHLVHELLVSIEFMDSDILDYYSPAQFCTILSFCQTLCCSTPYDPQELHISLSDDPSKMNIMWLTQEQAKTPTVLYGFSADNLNMSAVGTSRTYKWGGWNGFIYLVELDYLEYSTQYYYRVGDPAWLFSFSTFSFRSSPAPSAPNEIYKFITYGDMGSSNAADPNLYWLIQAAHNHEADVILHIGDISYADAYQPVWDVFMQKIEPVAAQIPYMTTPGNHEHYFNFAPYRTRFEMPVPQNNLGQTGRDNVTLYYSFNYGSSHVIALSAEMYWGNATDLLPGNAQYEWLQNDLLSVDRNINPWVIVFMHRPLYCTTNNPKRCEDEASYYRSLIEDLLYDYRVDLVLTAHNHNYERTLPVFNSTVMGEFDSETTVFQSPKAPIYAVIGTAGNHEGISSNFTTNLPSWGVAQSRHAEWGYAAFDFNATTLSWGFHSAQDNRVLDNFAIIK